MLPSFNAVFADGAASLAAHSCGYHWKAASHLSEIPFSFANTLAGDFIRSFHEVFDDGFGPCPPEGG